MERFSINNAKTKLGALLAAPVIALTPANHTDGAPGEVPVVITHRYGSIPTNPEVMFSGYKWNKQNPADTSPLIITYRFSELDTGRNETPGIVTSKPYTREQRQAFRRATQEYERFANIKFVEFRPGIQTNASDVDPQRPMIEVSVKSRLMGIEKGQSVEFLGYAPFPYTAGNKANTTNDLAAGLKDSDTRKSLGYYVILHEIGHNVGLKHPVDKLPGNKAGITREQDSVEVSIMSNNTPGQHSIFGKGKDHIKREDGFLPSGLMPLDIAALQKMYGANTSYNMGLDTHYFTEDSNDTLTLWNGGKPYRLDASRINANGNSEATLDANPGGFSLVGKEVVFNPLDATVTSLRGMDSGTNFLKGSERGNTSFEGGGGYNAYEFFGKGNRIITPAGAEASYYAPYPGSQAIIDGYDASKDRILFAYPSAASVTARKAGDDLDLEIRMGRADAARMTLRNFNGKVEDITVVQMSTDNTIKADITKLKRLPVTQSSMPSWLHKALTRETGQQSR